MNKLIILCFLICVSPARADFSQSEFKQIVEGFSNSTSIQSLPGSVSQRFSDSAEIFSSAELLISLYKSEQIEAQIFDYSPDETLPYYRDEIADTYREYLLKMKSQLSSEFNGYCDGTIDQDTVQKIEQRLKRVGLAKDLLCIEKTENRFDLYVQTTIDHTVSLTREFLKKRTYQTWPNVYAYIKSKNSNDQTPICVLGAHFDSVARDGGGRGPIVSPSVLAPGADDNASGTAGIFLLARELRNEIQNQDAPCDLLVAHFSGEEEGLFGSIAFTRLHNSRPILWMMNFDMIGYNKVEKSENVSMNIGFEKNSTAIAQKFISTDNQLKTVLVERENFIYSSDQISFWKIGVPAVSVSEQACSNEKCTDRYENFNPFLHTQEDKTSKMNFDYGTKILIQSKKAIQKLLFTDRVESISPKL